MANLSRVAVLRFVSWLSTGKERAFGRRLSGKAREPPWRSAAGCSAKRGSAAGRSIARSAPSPGVRSPRKRWLQWGVPSRLSAENLKAFELRCSRWLRCSPWPPSPPSGFGGRGRSSGPGRAVSSPNRREASARPPLARSAGEQLERGESRAACGRHGFYWKRVCACLCQLQK